VAILLEAHEPAVGDDDVLLSDGVDGHRGEVDQVLPQSVLIPVGDGQDE
jgi:hypothetical protein